MLLNFAGWTLKESRLGRLAVLFCRIGEMAQWKKATGIF